MHRMTLTSWTYQWSGSLSVQVKGSTLHRALLVLVRDGSCNKRVPLKATSLNVIGDQHSHSYSANSDNCRAHVCNQRAFARRSARIQPFVDCSILIDPDRRPRLLSRRVHSGYSRAPNLAITIPYRNGEQGRQIRTRSSRAFIGCRASSSEY